MLTFIVKIFGMVALLGISFLIVQAFNISSEYEIVVFGGVVIATGFIIYKITGESPIQ